MALFQSFWAGEHLSPYEVLCLKSFIDHGHSIHLYTYEKNLVAPEGVDICPAESLLPATDFFTYDNGINKGSPACFANLFRYSLLSDRGGWWIDTDVVCLSSSVPVDEEFFAFEDENFINCAIIKFPPRHPMMVLCSEAARDLGKSVKWGQTGPQLLTEIAKQLGKTSSSRNADTCYPISPQDALAPLKPSMTDFCRSKIGSCPFLHLWNSCLLNNGVDKRIRPPAFSYLRRLFDKHEVGGWQDEYLAPVTLKYDVLK